MTPQSFAQRAYTQSAASTRTPRDSEFEAISRITRRLRAAAEQKTSDFSGFVQALHDNRRLWSVLANDVADSENALPHQLRARIFYLAQFTDQHTAQILTKKAEVDPLLEINLSVLRGLRHSGGL